MGEKNVSVPFPGILFLNEIIQDRQKQRYIRFRPLPGDLISQLAVRYGIKNPSKYSFRPLPGDLISQ